MAYPVEARPSGLAARNAGIRVTGAIVVSSEANEKLILTLPKGRILNEAAPLLAAEGMGDRPQRPG